MQKMIKNNKENEEKNVVKNIAKKQTGITLIALVITIVLNSLRCGRNKECII